MSELGQKRPLPSLRLGRFTPQSAKAGVARLPRYIRCVWGPDSCAAAKLRIQSPPRRLAAHYGSRVQYALRTERYACAASSNPFLDTAVNTTPTRNGLPSLSVSAVVATRHAQGIDGAGGRGRLCRGARGGRAGGPPPGGGHDPGPPPRRGGRPPHR